MKQKLIRKDECVMVVGSLNAKEEDRILYRNKIVPLQIINEDGEIKPLIYFNTWGELGVSSIDWYPEKPFTWYITTGNDVKIVDLKNRSVKKLKISRLKDVHEITIINNILWISNAYYDEVVGFDLKKNRLLKRIQLKTFQFDSKEIEEEIEENQKFQVFDKFHCNQIFEGYEGNLYVLVHHVTGKQLIKKIAQKLIKSQGNGGVINFENKSYIRLALKAPHSVRKIANNYWVLDSGHSKLNIYNKEWKLKESINTSGWGRGADLSGVQELFYVGISATRKRYLGLIPGGNMVPNMVQVFSVKKKYPIGEFIISNVEQINNIYVISKEVAEEALNFLLRAKK